MISLKNLLRKGCLTFLRILVYSFPVDIGDLSVWEGGVIVICGRPVLSHYHTSRQKKKGMGTEPPTSSVDDEERRVSDKGQRRQSL